ncbi:MAG: Rrf2 family transcriptional regulator [Candidatus Omnitrophica bacterium]|nr:Rrf2 family transcriptional regulator [Candidatus Omnitrophota bacterium]
MKLSARSTYGLLAMYALALRYPQGPISVSSIAEKEKISLPYLEQILNRLKKKGLVGAERGPKGGYRLAKPPEAITIGEIVRTLENGLESLYDGKIQNGKNGLHPIVNLVWGKLAQRMKEVLEATSLKELCEEVKRLGLDELMEHRYTFHI